jgi:hypothetical protein
MSIFRDSRPSSEWGPLRTSMIGVLSKKDEKEIVAEFFQLFKTPWEFYEEGKEYDVLIVTTGDFETAKAKFVLLYSSEQIAFDSKENIGISPLNGDTFLEFEKDQIPIYRGLATISGLGEKLISIKTDEGCVALGFERSGQAFARVGYNLFDEVSFLLLVGQPPENAHVPSLDVHIELLRKLILAAGIPFVEIPPVPAGRSFIVFLTHDIDFIRIRDHKFDHTMWGFLYRATIGTILNLAKGKNTWNDVLKNLKAAVTLPLVYLGLAEDFWFKFDRYVELERKVDASSTFFLIPFKNRIGEKITGKGSEFRAAKYDVTDIRDTVAYLVNNGFEVGVHGIDAWHSGNAARVESARISQVSGKNSIGIRMHWLCFGRDTHKLLDDAGFCYDSTFGYNDTVGYRAGTTQPFRPIGTKQIFELPLNIQDTALFNPRRMSLSKPDAWQRVEDLIDNNTRFGGMLTVLWHDRSLSPERLYENFYIRLLAFLRDRNVWFAPATDICNWFARRRTVHFENVDITNDAVRVKLKPALPDIYPSMALRIYYPASKNRDFSNGHRQCNDFTEVPLQGEIHFNISGKEC